MPPRKSRVSTVCIYTPLLAGDATTERMFVTAAMALNAAFRTSCEHPGFTIVRTWQHRYDNAINDRNNVYPPIQKV